MPRCESGEEKVHGGLLLTGEALFLDIAKITMHNVKHPNTDRTIMPVSSHRFTLSPVQSVLSSRYEAND